MRIPQVIQQIESRKQSIATSNIVHVFWLFLVLFFHQGVVHNISIPVLILPLTGILAIAWSTRLMLVLSSLFLLGAIVHSGVEQVDVASLLIGYLRMFALSCLLVCFYHYLLEIQESYFKGIGILSKIAIVLAVLALGMLWSGTLSQAFWYFVPYTQGVVLPRLKLWELEPSHLSLVLGFCLVLLIFRLLYHITLQRIIYCILLGCVLLLSFSLGILGALAIASLATIVMFLPQILQSKLGKRSLSIGFLAVLLVGVSLVVLAPKNPLVFRLQHVFSGNDTSAKGRTSQAFYLSDLVINRYDSELFGIGPGQFKTLGRVPLLSFYGYKNIPPKARIPNGLADTFCTFGYIGLVLKVGLILFLLFRGKLWRHPDLFMLWCFLFVYQITGSYALNLIEWLLWTFLYAQAQIRRQNMRTLLSSHPIALPL